MSFSASIPQGTDPILQSQAQIRANFRAINNTFNNNHFPLTGDTQFQGYHTVMTMRPESGDPTTLATTVSLYNKLDANSIPELFFRPNSNQTPIQLTYPSIVTTGAKQYSFVAGPFIIYGGLLSAPTNGQTITLTPTSTLLYVGITSANVVRSPTVFGDAIPTNITGSTFQIKWQSASSTKLDAYYLAIGM